jgi:hypothetical protein
MTYTEPTDWADCVGAERQWDGVVTLSMGGPVRPAIMEVTGPYDAGRAIQDVIGRQYRELIRS